MTWRRETVRGGLGSSYLKVHGGFQRVEFPEVLFQQVRTMLCPSRAVLIDGEVSQLGNEALRHIADAVHFLDQGH
jgi:hypothetical protein